MDSNNSERYYEVQFPVGSSNVLMITLLECKDCGALVFNRTAHDAYHRQEGRIW